MQPFQRNRAYLKERVTEYAKQVARRPETKFGAGGFALGALATVALLGSMLQPAGVHAISGLSAPRALYAVVLDDKAAA